MTAYALKSEIPSVGNGSITIKQGNDVKGTFTMNQSNNLTVELSAGGSGGGDETDPVFTSWLSSDAVVAGSRATSGKANVALGSLAKAESELTSGAGNVALGFGAEATGRAYTTALGAGAKATE